MPPAQAAGRQSRVRGALLCSEKVAEERAPADLDKASGAQPMPTKGRTEGAPEGRTGDRRCAFSAAAKLGLDCDSWAGDRAHSLPLLPRLRGALLGSSGVGGSAA